METCTTRLTPAPRARLLEHGACAVDIGSDELGERAVFFDVGGGVKHDVAAGHATLERGLVVEIAVDRFGAERLDRAGGFG